MEFRGFRLGLGFGVVLGVCWSQAQASASSATRQSRTSWSQRHKRHGTQYACLFSLDVLGVRYYANASSVEGGGVMRGVSRPSLMPELRLQMALWSKAEPPDPICVVVWRVAVTIAQPEEAL